MLGHRFFGLRYFGNRYFGDGGDGVPVSSWDGSRITRTGIADVATQAAMEAASANIPGTTTADVAAALGVKRWVATWLRKWYNMTRI